ncbi:prepilin-type N-terminal cleavage/methylation domain-containing protein [Polaromonas sp.]|uniref:prepilin-type N-terminal cleavage/methylation domain-containing protein n=1 Tax=Polaromonas sp. TaxID=1869339 RepID=UPI0035664D9C
MNRITFHALRFHTALKARQRGFSLIEIALVLVIVGLALGTGLSLLSAKTAQARIDSTKERAAAVRQALVNYVAQNSRLPCPAAPGLVRGVAGYNVEQRNLVPVGGEVCIAASGLVNNINGTALTGVSRGTVPCTTLGLPEDTCTDAWGVRFTYFVQNVATRLTTNNISGIRGTMTVHTIVPPAAATPANGLAPTGNQINACTATVGDNSCNGFAVAMIISHGANRGGGFVPTSAVVLPTAGVVSAYELENTNNTIQFIQNDYVETGANSFDDIVVPLVPRDVIASLSQTGALRQTGVLTTERFETIKIAIINQSFATPIGTGTTPNKQMTLSTESGAAAPYAFPGAPTLDFTNCGAAPTTTQLLPLVAPPASQTNVPALAGLINDLWGTPIRYRRVVTTAFGASNNSCVTPFVLISYGPDGQTGGVFANDDIIFPVTKADITTLLGRLGLTW